MKEGQEREAEGGGEERRREGEEEEEERLQTNEDSMASMYINSRWEEASEGEEEEQNAGEENEKEKEKSKEQGAEAHTTTLYTIGFEPSESEKEKRTHTGNRAFESVHAPILSMTEAGEEELLAAVEWTGMPAEDASLREAIRTHFRGRRSCCTRRRQRSKHAVDAARGDTRHIPAQTRPNGQSKTTQRRISGCEH